MAIYNRLLTKPNQRSLYNAISSGAALGIGQGIMFWVYAFAFWYGGRLVETGEMNLESTLKVFFSILLATMGISQAQMAFPDVSKGSKAVARVFRGAPFVATAPDRISFYSPRLQVWGRGCGSCCVKNLPVVESSCGCSMTSPDAVVCVQ